MAPAGFPLKAGMTGSAANHKKPPPLQAEFKKKQNLSLFDIIFLNFFNNLSDTFYMNYRFLVFHICFFLLLSCGGNPNAVKQGIANTDEETDTVRKRRTEKEPDTEKQDLCNKKATKRTACDKDDDCEDICDDRFEERKHKRYCYKLPESLVLDFDELLEATEDGDIEDIKIDTLECLLDIDERGFAKAVSDMNQRDAKEFLIAIIDESETKLPEILEEEDNELIVLENLLNKATGVSKSNLIRQLSVEIDDNKNVLRLIGEAAKPVVLKWLGKYVEQVREDEDESDNRDLLPSAFRYEQKRFKAIFIKSRSIYQRV